MKRDSALMDRIITVLEKDDAPFLGEYEISERITKSTNNEYSDEQISHHILITADAGLVIEKRGDIRLTNAGYLRLEEIRRKS